jgi:hypothetical protein
MRAVTNGMLAFRVVNLSNLVSRHRAEEICVHPRSKKIKSCWLRIEGAPEIGGQMPAI